MSDRKSDADARERRSVKRDDDEFFEHHPDRQYRVRRAAAVEIRQKQFNGGLPPLAPGDRWFLALWNLAPGRRVCLFIANRPDVDTNLTDGEAQAVFDLAMEGVPDLGQSLSSAAEAANATLH